MRGRHVLALILTLLLTAASTASAAWHAAGSREPDTPQDLDLGMMFEHPDASPGGPSGLYFNAFQTVEGATVNPNVASAGTRILAPGPAHHRAMLGLWKDCNRDGHVGLSESAVLEYRSELLLDDSVCPPGGAHHFGGWVVEMIGVGMVDPCEYAAEPTRTAECDGIAPFHANEHVLYANGTMVWADAGEPGVPPAGECPLAPPRGTTSGTGLLLAYLACQEGRRVETAIVAAGVDPTLLDVPFPVTPFGGPSAPGLFEAGSESPAATAWDCTQPRATAVPDPTGELGSFTVEDPSGGQLTGEQGAVPVLGKQTIFYDEDDDASTPGTRTVVLADQGALVWIPAAAPAVHDPTASWWDAAEALADGPRGDCDGESALRPYAPGPYVESGAPIVEEGRKDRASLAFTFYDGHRGLHEDVDPYLGTATTPSDAGLLYMRHGRGGAGPLWSADEASANEPQVVTRGTLEPTGATFWTYYATLGPDALEAGLLPTLQTRTYGAEACGDATSGIHGGWVCDAEAWWLDALGHDARPRYLQGEPYGPLPGQLYHLLDVDCYDGHIAASAVFASAAALSNRVC